MKKRAKGRINKRIIRKKKKYKLLIAIVPLSCIFMLFSIDHNNLVSYSEKALNHKFNQKIISSNLSTDYEIENVLKNINKMGLNTINIPIVINIDTLTSNTMDVDKNSVEKAINLLKELEGKNISIILEPYPWINDGSLSETEWIPSDISTFFYNWKNNVIDYLIKNICDIYDIDALNISSNLVRIESYETEWLDVIAFVRQEYDGLVTYRTNWWYTLEGDAETQKRYENKLNNKLFGELDFISVSAYFELTDQMNADVDDIVNALTSTNVYNRNQNVKQEVYNFYEKWNKPIFFGELGFPKRLGASIEPHNSYLSRIYSSSQQVNCFKAYNKVFKNEDWLIGFSIFAIGDKSYEKAYYPCIRSKKIIKNWYK